MRHRLVYYSMSLICLATFLFFYFIDDSKNVEIDKICASETSKAVVVQNGNALAKTVAIPDSVYELRGFFDLNGDSLVLPVGCVLKGIDAIMANGIVVLSNNCTIENLKFQNVKVVFDDKQRLRIKHCSFEGNFKTTTIPEQNYMSAAIYGNRGKDVYIENVSICNYQWGISVFRSSRLIIENISFSGVLSDSIDFSSHIENSNYHDAVHIAGTNESRIAHVNARNCGACVLLGNTSKYNIIENCCGNNLWDNGVYISSGNDNIVKSCEFQNVRGTGVKARGCRNIIMNNTVSVVGTGYGITGRGKPIGIDDYGQEYNGEGSSIVDNIVEDFHDYGVAVALYEGYPTSRVYVDNNRIFNGFSERPSISVYCSNARVSGNEINCPNSYGIVVPLIKEKTTGGYVILNNSITCNRRGIAVSRCKNATVSNNKIYAEKQGLVVSETEGSSFIHNEFTGNGKYYISDNIIGKRNYYETFGDNDGIKPSDYSILEKRK